MPGLMGRFFLLLAAVSYGVLLLWGGQYWWAGVHAYLPVTAMLMLLLPSLLGALILLQLRAAALHLLAAALIIILYGAPAWQRPAPQAPVPDAAPSLRVLSYNVHQRHDQAIVNFVRGLDADILLLQEDESGSDGLNLALALAKGNKELHSATAGELSIITRYPILGLESKGLGSYRNALTARLKLGQRQLTVINVHFRTISDDSPVSGPEEGLRRYLPETWAVRKRQTEGLLQYAVKSGRYLLIAGDFNSTPSSPPCRSLRRRFNDAFAQSGTGLGFSFHSRLPLLRIDHLFTGQGLKPVSARVIPGRLSDHRLLLCELALN